MSYTKKMDEPFDTLNLRVIESAGGNKPLHDHLQEYGADKKPIPEKYNCDAALWYHKRLVLKSRGIGFTERKPPRNNRELAEQTAADSTNTLNAHFVSAQGAWKEYDQKYKIADTAKEKASKAKNAFMGLFSKKKPEDSTEAAATPKGDKKTTLDE